MAAMTREETGAKLKAKHLETFQSKSSGNSLPQSKQSQQDENNGLSSKELVAHTAFKNIMKDVTNQTVAKDKRKEKKGKNKGKKKETSKGYKDVCEDNEENRGDIDDYAGGNVSELDRLGEMMAAHILKFFNALITHQVADYTARKSFAERRKENTDSKENKTPGKQLSKSKTIDAEKNREIALRQRQHCQQPRGANRSVAPKPPSGVKDNVQPENAGSQLSQVQAQNQAVQVDVNPGMVGAPA